MTINISDNNTLSYNNKINTALYTHLSVVTGSRQILLDIDLIFKLDSYLKSILCLYSSIYIVPYNQRVDVNKEIKSKKQLNRYITFLYTHLFSLSLLYHNIYLLPIVIQFG